MILDTDFAGGPGRLAQRVFALGAKAVEEHGARLEITGNFDAFSRVDRDGSLPYKGYHPDFTNATRGASLIVRKDGKAIATGAAALFETYERSMADLIHENGLYDDGGDDGVRMSRECRDWLESISGRVMYIGGIWIHRKHRKTELSRLLVPLLPLISSTIAVQLWDARHIVSLVEYPILEKGVVDRYRVWFRWPGATIRLGGRELPMILTYSAPIQATLDARGFIRSGPEYLLSPLSLPGSSDSIQRAA